MSVMSRFLSWWIVALAIGLLAVAVMPPVSAQESGSYEESISAYRTARLERLRSDTGWLTIAGFHWLQPGDNPFGSDPENKVALPEGGAPEHAGMIRLTETSQKTEVVVETNPDVEIRVDDKKITGSVTIWDGSGEAKQVSVGRVTFWVIPRAGRYAIRVRDPESPLRTEFKGIEFYQVDRFYRVAGKFEPFATPKQILVPNFMGYIDSSYCPGKVSFTIDGEFYDLLPMTDGPEDSTFFLVFQDKTSGKETYGGGRFLYADLGRDGILDLDFNKAYNPPCAFNDKTTCPLPPAGNILPIPLRVGEKGYAGRDH
jgi:uncharacterized protein (DUF1684 family)